MTPTGPDLRRERRLAEVSVVDLAARMGLSRQAVHGLERAAHPDPERIAQYQDALATLRAGIVPATPGAA